MPDLRQQADDLLLRGDYPAARTAYEALLASGADDAHAHRGLGLALLESGDLASAAAAFDLAIARSPQDGELAYQRSRPHLRAKEWDLALPHLDRAIALAPDLADAYWGRSALHSQRQNRAQELADGEKYCALRPDDAQGRAFLAHPHRALGNLAAALEACQAALRINPQSAEAHRQLGYTRKAMKEDAAALAAFEESVRLNPANAAELEPEVARLRSQIGALAPAATPAPAPPPPAKPAPPVRRRLRERISSSFSSFWGLVCVVGLSLGALVFAVSLAGSLAVGVAKGADIVYGSSYIVWNWNDSQRVPHEAQLCKKMFCRDPHTTEKHMAGSPGHQSESFSHFCDRHERSPWLSFLDIGHLGGFFWLLARGVACISAAAIWGLAFWLLMQPFALPVAWWRKRAGHDGAFTQAMGASGAVAAVLGVVFGAASAVVYAWF